MMEFYQESLLSKNMHVYNMQMRSKSRFDYLDKTYSHNGRVRFKINWLTIKRYETNNKYIRCKDTCSIIFVLKMLVHSNNNGADLLWMKFIKLNSLQRTVSQNLPWLGQSFNSFCEPSHIMWLAHLGSDRFRCCVLLLAA